MPKFNSERLGKIILYILVDSVLIVGSLAVSISLWYDGAIPGSHPDTVVPPEAWQLFWLYVALAPVICVVIFAAFQIYQNLWKYASIDEVYKIFLAVTVVFLALYGSNIVLNRYLGHMLLPRRLYFVAWILFFSCFTFSRFGYRAVRRLIMLAEHTMTSKAGCRRVMVVGAGFGGYGVVSGLLNRKIRDSMPVIIVDDDESKANTYLLGIRVLSGISKIVEVADKYQIDEIIIAKPSATEEELREIMRQCTRTDCTLKIMPPISDVEGVNTAGKLRDVNISDLLFREEVTLDTKNIREFLHNRVIMVTGGGGSIGSELCRQIAKFEPRCLIIFDIYENNAYDLLNELMAKQSDSLNLVIRIGSVRDMQRLEMVFEEFHPNVIFHAAAHKHVPMMEENAAEAVKNNVFGAYNVMMCAHRFKAERFVVLSTDKAVNPTSVMGATKRITEIIMQSMAAKGGKTKFMAVRFGNVLGSSGSVIPLFQQQIMRGGPVTVTHPNIQRYFMTIPEAAQLVLQATGLGNTGCIFVLDMGDPVKIDDLARNLIKLSGYKEDRDIKIEYTGLRPGEKLYEELMMAEEEEQMQVSFHKKIYTTKPIDIDYDLFEKHLKTLYDAAHKKPEKVYETLQKILPNFK